MADAVIEGSVTPAAGVLARGERRTVALTDHIRDLSARGYITIVEVIEPEPDPAPVDTPAPAPAPDPEPRSGAIRRRPKKNTDGARHEE